MRGKFCGVFEFLQKFRCYFLHTHTPRVIVVRKDLRTNGIDKRFYIRIPTPSVLNFFCNFGFLEPCLFGKFIGKTVILHGRGDRASSDTVIKHKFIGIFCQEQIIRFFKRLSGCYTEFVGIIYPRKTIIIRILFKTREQRVFYGFPLCFGHLCKRGDFSVCVESATERTIPCSGTDKSRHRVFIAHFKICPCPIFVTVKSDAVHKVYAKFFKF